MKQQKIAINWHMTFSSCINYKNANQFKKVISNLCVHLLITFGVIFPVLHMYMRIMCMCVCTCIMHLCVCMCENMYMY